MFLKSQLARRLFLAFYFAALVALFSLEAQSQSNVNVRVMAANLNGNTQSYQPFAIRIFQGLKPDVVCIQEFNYASTNGLGTSTPAAMREMIDTAFGTNFVYYREPLNGGGDIPNGIISRYPFIQATNWTDTQVANRGFAWAQIDLPGTNDLYVVSVHLLTSSPTARATEANNLKALMQATFPPNAWIVVAGDFNADPRTETCVTTFNGYLTDYPIPVDQNGDSNTSSTTNSNGTRKYPHDYVLPSLTFTNFETATVMPSRSFPTGQVFDSRVYTPPSDVDPVQSADSGLAQHMAVMKDFLIPVSGTTNAPVTNAPSITSQPQSQTVSPGSNVTFTVAASGTAPLAYQWLFNNTAIAAATTNFYFLPNSQVSDSGNYSVVVTNIAGSITSSIAVLSVTNLPPGILVNPAAQSVFVGGSATFNVTANGTVPLFYQWCLGGTNIAGANANTYSLSNIQLTNAGNYTVVITNFVGSITSAPALLTVNPIVTGTPVLLAGWDTSSQANFGTSPLPPSTNAPSVTVGGLTRGGGVATPSGAAARGWGGTGFTDSTSAAAVTANHYATFSIAANAGYKVSYSSVSKFDYRHSSTGPPSGVLQYQVGGSAFTDIIALSYSSSSSSGASIPVPIDLSGIAPLQNIPAGTNVTFRIVSYGASGSGGTWYVYDVASSPAPDLAIQGIITSNANPPAAAVLSSPSLSVGQFQMLVTGTAGSNYVVQVVTNLLPANWTGLFTNASPFTFTDLDLTAPQKFYRAIVQP